MLDQHVENQHRKEVKLMGIAREIYGSEEQMKKLQPVATEVVETLKEKNLSYVEAEAVLCIAEIYLKRQKIK